MKNVFIVCFIYRALSIVLIRTHFVADEFWQSLEVAHGTVFGNGYRTWEFQEKIRCLFYPSLFSVIDKVLKVFAMDSVENIVFYPRLLQAIFTALADVCFYRLCTSFRFPVKNIYLFIFFDWFLFYCGSRTLINTFEYNLTVFALYFFPWGWCFKNTLNGSFHFFTSFVVINCFIRPTACILWAPFCVLALYQMKRSIKFLFVLSFFLVGLLITLALTTFDSFMYGSLTFTPWNFLHFNVIKNISGFYGVHPFYWYFTSGVPIVLGVFTIPLVLDLISTCRSWRKTGM